MGLSYFLVLGVQGPVVCFHVFVSSQSCQKTRGENKNNKPCLCDSVFVSSLCLPLKPAPQGSMGQDDCWRAEVKTYTPFHEGEFSNEGGRQGCERMKRNEEKVNEARRRSD